MSRQPPVHQTEKGHYDFLHRVGICAVSGKQSEPIQVAHLRRLEFCMNKDQTGAAQKPHYRWTIPMSWTNHAAQEDMGLDLFFEKIGWRYENVYYGPLVVSQVLFAMSLVDDVEGAQRYICANVLARRARATELVFPEIRLPPQDPHEARAGD